MTGLATYDALGSVMIGCLLGCTAIFLIGQNRSLLIGDGICRCQGREHMDTACLGAEIALGLRAPYGWGTRSSCLLDVLPAEPPAAWGASMYKETAFQPLLEELALVVWLP